jgi:molybdopterin-guanine dinucleotide biosynthesis protein A
MTAPDIVAIVLAGGASSRFGSDKLTAELEGRPLLHHAVEAVAAVAGSIVVVIAPEAPAPPIPAALASSVVVARDATAHGGPLAGLAAGLAAIDTPVRDEAPRIALVVGGDMPRLVPAVLRLLTERLAAEDDLAAMTLAASRLAPLPLALRSVPARAAVAACLADGGRSLRALLRSVPSSIVPETDWRVLDPEGRSLFDVDTPADLEAG